jgi:hypothetical protein
MKKKLLFISACIAMIFSNKAYSQERLKTDGEIPIVAWVGVPESEISVERFLELKESGINTNMSFYSNLQVTEKALECAREAGVKIIANCPEIKNDTEKAVRKLMKHPALAGYYLKDEPNAGEFPELGDWARKIQAIDSKHYCYLNLFPNYASREQLFGPDAQEISGKNDYAEHVAAFIREVPLPFVSYDHYSIVVEKGTRVQRPKYFENLDIIATQSQKSGLPFWAFALASSHWDYPVPTVGELRLQMFSNLAYGAQGLQYFTYWTPGTDYQHGPIEMDGTRSVVYDRIKLVNQEIQNLAGVFLGAKMISVWHTGDYRLPDGTRRVISWPTPVKTLVTSENGAVVSLLEKGDRQFLVIVNRDFQNLMKLTFIADNQVQRVLKDGTLILANKYSPTTEVDPGDIVIYSWKK